MSLLLGIVSSSNKKQIVQDGLIVHIDPDITASYSGSGATIYNLVNNQAQTLYGNYSKATPGIRLTNASSDLNANVSRLQIQSYASIRTICLWLYDFGNSTVEYILDARSGLANGYIYDGSVGPDWQFMYVNNGSKITPTTADAFVRGSWRMLTFEAVSNFTDDVTMFSRFSNNEGLNCTFGKIMFYNKILSSSEVATNFNATKSLYGL